MTTHAAAAGVSAVSVYDMVAEGKLSPDEGAKLLMKQRGPLVRKPAWMPQWIYVAVVLIGAVVFAPIMSSGRNHHS